MIPPDATPAPGPVPAQPASLTREQEYLVKDTIFHVLDAIQSDPRKYFLMGRGTGSFKKLTTAYASLNGLPVDQVIAMFKPDQASYDAWLRERNEDARLADVGRKAEQGGAP